MIGGLDHSGSQPFDFACLVHFMVLKIFGKISDRKFLLYYLMEFYIITFADYGSRAVE